ncbi:unnamed protein product [Notodromas monacha]|uniref:PAS domain-containing protein n=1 Tax=Notodromas monacha TaxID=399045 RepID=A0A7R9BLR4_9CRUS|nr:unnamed protein product [Notodromas monacha]CAG0916961.1 unnamed protein product [Notodromas monacha]
MFAVAAGRAGKTTRNNSSSIGGNSGDTSSDAEQDGDGSTSPAATNSTSTSISTLTTTSTSSRPTRRRGYSWIFVGVVTPSRIPTTLLQLSMVQAVQDEYVMRNNIEGKIVSVDHRSIGGNSGDTSSDAEQDGDGSTSPAATNSTSTSISTLTTTSTSSRPTRRRGYSWIFVGVVTPSRIPTTLLQLSMVQAVQDEYVMRNNIEGKIVSVDHRISYLTGFSVSEVRGHNAFAFIHEDDRERIAQEYLRMLYKSEDGTGHVIYRLKTKSSQVVYLRTRGFLEFNRSTQRVESYVCINTLITEDEAMKLDETYRTNQRKLIKDCIVPGGNHASTSSSVKCLPALPDAAKSSTATSTTTFPDSDNDSSKCLNNNDDYSRNKNLDEANASEDRHRNQVSSPRILNISRNRENSLSSASSLFLAQKIFDRPELGLIKYADEDGEEIMAPVSILAPDQRRHLKLAGCAPVRAESLVSSTVSTPDDIDVVPDSNGRSSTPDLDECLFRIETPVPFPEPSPFSEAMLYSGLDVTPERTMTTTSSLTCWYDDGPVNTPQCTPVIDGSVELDGATRAKRVKLDGAVHAWTRQTANS